MRRGVERRQQQQRQQQQRAAAGRQSSCATAAASTEQERQQRSCSRAALARRLTACRPWSTPAPRSTLSAWAAARTAACPQTTPARDGAGGPGRGGDAASAPRLRWLAAAAATAAAGRRPWQQQRGQRQQAAEAGWLHALHESVRGCPSARRQAQQQPQPQAASQAHLHLLPHVGRGGDLPRLEQLAACSVAFRGSRRRQACLARQAALRPQQRRH